MIDKNQTVEQVHEAAPIGWRTAACEFAACDTLLVYAIPTCETCDGRGWEMVDGMYPHGTVEQQECGACNGTGYQSVRVIPEATLRRLVNAWLGYSALVHLRDDPLIAQLIEEFADG